MEEREHPATERQRGRFRERGDLAFSRELTTAGELVAGSLTLAALAPLMGHSLSQLVVTSLGNLDTGMPFGITTPALTTYAGVAGPVLFAAMAGAIGIGVAQTGGNFATEKLGLDFTRLNPLPKLQQLFASKDALINLSWSFAKAVLVAVILSSFLRDHIKELLGAAPQTGAALWVQIASLLSGLALRASLTMLALGGLDWGINWYRVEQRMRMSTQEVKDDHKNDLGDPHIRQVRRRRARELLRQRSMKRVPHADVVLVNPTHFAVAIEYKPQKMRAPRVVAKGADLIAERIRTIAREAGVPILSQPPLTRELFKRVKVGREVPSDLYKPIAVVLAHVYRTHRRSA